jgi:hypothetical protein
MPELQVVDPQIAPLGEGRLEECTQPGEWNHA